MAERPLTKPSPIGSVDEVIPDPTKLLNVFRRIPRDGGPPEQQALQPVFFYIFEDRDNEAYIIQLQEVSDKGFELEIRYNLDIRPLTNRSPAFDAKRKEQSVVVVTIPESKKNALFEEIVSVPRPTDVRYNAYNWAIRVEKALMKRLEEHDDLTDQDRQKLEDMLETTFVTLADFRRTEQLLLYHAL